MIPRDGAIATLTDFCAKHSKQRKIGHLTVAVDTIIRLAHLVLDTNYFVFDTKYYKQIRGAVMGLPFTMTIAHIYIYIYEWEQSLIKHQQTD